MKHLPDILAEDEMPEELLTAEYDDRRGLNVSRTYNIHGLLVCTDRRLMFVHKHLGSAPEVHEFPYDAIDRVDSSTGWVNGDFKVYSHGIEEIFKAEKSGVIGFVYFLNKKIA